MQIVVGLILVGVLYLIYVPNFLSVKDIRVIGLSDSNQVIAEGAARQAIRDALFLNPQYNMIFLDNDLVSKAVAKVPSVYEVKSVKKDFKHNTVIIEVVPKVERYLVSDTERVYDVYNDGIAKSVSGLSQDNWASTVNPSMIKVLLPSRVPAEDGKTFFGPQMIQALESIAGGLNALPGSPLSYFLAGTASVKTTLNDDGSTSVSQGDLEFPVNNGEIKAVLKKGNTGQTFTVMFDPQSNLGDTLKRLELLLAQTPPDRYKNLYYIDMRLPNKGYVCLVNTPCAK
jgi:hypothetical protein